MTTLQLGSELVDLTVLLTKDADFVANIRRDDGLDWPGTAAVSLVVETSTVTSTWPATIDGDTLRWNVDKVDVNEAIANKPKRVQLWYVDGTADLVWASGKVKVSK